MDSLSITDIKRLLQKISREVGDVGRVIHKFPSDAMKLVMGQLAEWIAAINLHDDYAAQMEDCDHVPFLWLTGEEGIGKSELVLRIHEHVERKDILNLDCKSKEEDVIRSELFGHKKGVALKDGKFWKAKKGLLIIYEPQRLPFDCQERLLKEWQKLRPIQKLGSRVEHPDPVIIFVSRSSPEETISTRAVLPGLLTKMLPHIHIPPLRERPEDVAVLIEHVFRTKGHEFRGRELSAERDLEEEALFLLVNFHWPGNISALREVVTRLIFSVPLSNHERGITFPTVIGSLEARYGHDILNILTPLFRRTAQSKKRSRTKRDHVWLDELRLLRRLIDMGYREKDLAKALGISRFTLSRWFTHAGRLEDAPFAPVPKGKPPKSEPHKSD